MKKRTIILLFSLFATSFIWANHESPNDSSKTKQRHYQTTKVTTQPPAIDGLLEDEAWKSVDWSSGFIQRQPNEGEKPQNQTSFKILYDEKNIYVAFRCHDSEPEKIVRRLTRRDDFDGDRVSISIDSYNDKRTAFSFTINAAGVIGDEFITNNGSNWDENWNSIWYAKTNIDEEGWTAEVKIPLSQLRFGNESVQKWGLQVARYDFRHQERSNWKFISQNTAGWVSNFGALEGIKDIEPQKQVEIQPYILAQASIFEKEEGNPYATGFDTKMSAGLDAKIGVTNDLTLDLAINPDFGQVEADPAALNLDGFQIFFSERRPFFIENRNIFDFQVTYAEAGGPFRRDNLFYSRRIGSSPHGSAQNVDEDNEYVNTPSNTTILGAAKFSGKTKSGTSIGILESVTQREIANISDGSNERSSLVEPLTSYFVGRVQQDFNKGNTYVGGILTATNRNLENSYLQEFLHKSAYSGAIDFMHRWKNQSWYLAGTGIFSLVNGTTDAITNTQSNFEHNYVRTDAEHLSVDTLATSLAGHGGTFRLGKIGGNFKFESGLTWRSPGVELNDVGFMRQADHITQFQWVGYRVVKPSEYLNNWRVNYNHWLVWDFSGRNTHIGFNVNVHAQLKNFWGGGTGTFYRHRDIDTRALRGGPGLRSPKGINHWWYLRSDGRKKVRINLNGWNFWGAEKSSRSSGMRVRISAQPTRTLNISLEPNYELSSRILQYVDNIELDNGETRYINGSINNQTFGMSIRANYTIRPNMSIQFYAQPFISRGEYSEFKYITAANAEAFSDRFVIYEGGDELLPPSSNSDNQIFYSEDDYQYYVDENKDGNIDYEFENPNFNYIQFRSNLVFRWEYIPGSTLFVVWTQGNNFSEDSENPFEQPILTDVTNNLFENTANNIFLVKFTYRFLK
ncbi:MAG: DUF5916 domain-containing protein [Saprospiraceae bacterium]